MDTRPPSLTTPESADPAEADILRIARLCLSGNMALGNATVAIRAILAARRPRDVARVVIGEPPSYGRV